MVRKATSKPKLKCKVETVTLVEYGDLEQFVREVYPALKKWSFVAGMECGNDSRHQFTVPFFGCDAEEWVEGVRDYPTDLSPYTVMEKLATDGYLKNPDTNKYTPLTYPKRDDD